MRCPGGGTAPEKPASPAPGVSGAAIARTASRSTWAATKSAMASSIASEPRQLRGLHQAEVALGQGQRLAARQRAEHGEAGGFNGIGGETAVAFAGDAVQHDAADAHARVQRGATGGHGRGGLRLPRDVEHQQHRQAEPGGEVGGGAGLARGSGHAVEEAHRALADQQVGAGRRAPRQRADECRRHRPGVEVEAVATGRGGVEGGIDVVRPVLAGRHRDPGAGEGAQQAQRHHRLAAARARRRDDQPGRAFAGSANGCGASRARARRCGRAGTRDRTRARSCRRAPPGSAAGSGAGRRRRGMSAGEALWSARDRRR